MTKTKTQNNIENLTKNRKQKNKKTKHENGTKNKKIKTHKKHPNPKKN